VRCFLIPLLLVAASTAPAKVVVFWQAGFPVIESQPVAHATLERALGNLQPVFSDANGLPSELKPPNAPELLVLPYGSAFPVDAWPSIFAYLRNGGNLLVLGGQPFRVPVMMSNGAFHQEAPQDTFSRSLGIVHTYQAPQTEEAHFEWREGYSFFPAIHLEAPKFFVLEGHLDGLAYMKNTADEKTASPVVIFDHTQLGRTGEAMLGARFVMLDFQPTSGFWDAPDGVNLIRTAAAYAAQGATSFWLETQFSTLRPGENPQVTVHLRNALRQRRRLEQQGSAEIQLLSGSRVVETKRVSFSGPVADNEIDFGSIHEPGFYEIRGTYDEDDRKREFYENGFWVADEKAVRSGPVLAVKGDFLTRSGEPFLPVGTNYFTTEERGWDFSGPRNAYVWKKDFADMKNHGVTFVRTGVWMDQQRFLDPEAGGVPERFLRNLEAYLLSAQEYGIVVNFTFSAFDPQTTLRMNGERSVLTFPGTNPYLDPATIQAEQDYILSVVNRFKDVPYLCWDLINEPSFSNPNRLWKGNTPNGDPTELSAWHKWLRSRYNEISNLASAWSVPADRLGSFDNVPLPADSDLMLSRYRNTEEVRAFDYNLFAQDMFSNWVHTMVTAIHSTGSNQLIDVGQDEGGVTNRVLNQFYSEAGVSFTTNHTYWQDEALLWDSVAAKRPGIPNLVGETGYQPVWGPSGEWRYDEITGADLIERKWALGFAAGNTGALQWDWAREVDFGMERSDGSAKLWEQRMSELARFAKSAAPYATSLILPEVAIVLPQSLQLSVFNPQALEAQQSCVRALFNFARVPAYAVGEYQTQFLGDPKLIIVPSPWVFSDRAWNDIVAKVEQGSILLISGRFDQDPHFHASTRPSQLGLSYRPGLLTARENKLVWPAGEALLTYTGEKTTYLDRAILPDGSTFTEKPCGKGKILFSSLPLELNSNLEAIADVYRYALKTAHVDPDFSTSMQDPGILICPTRFPHATLYVLTSESNQSAVSFTDNRSRKSFTGQLQPGRAALLLIEDTGKLAASYNWHGTQ
jgi:hypothetical protein